MDDVVLGNNNEAETPTRIRRSPAGTALILNSGNLTSPGVPVCFMATDSSSGGIGAWGYAATAGTGVLGNGAVVGVRGNTGSGVGILGEATSGTGVQGTATNGIPVRGEATGSSAGTSAAVLGVNLSTYTGGAPGNGGFGVYGFSASGHGLVGATSASGGAAVVGASNGVSGAYAAVFYGSVVVTGSFAVAGPKSAAIPHPDGSHRLVYCVESPESWLEDFGRGRLECGKAVVALDKDFTAVADMSDYHVFLSESGQHRLLAITAQQPDGFTVEADQALAKLKGLRIEDVQGEFSWRVVAKRKDISAERLAPIVLPKAVVLPTVSPTPSTPLPQVFDRE